MSSLTIELTMELRDFVRECVGDHAMYATPSEYISDLIRGNRESWYARPVFFVTDCEKSLRFYGDLGFREAWRHEVDGTLIALQVNRDGAELILNLNASRAGGGRLFLSLNRGQAAKCVEAFVAAGIAVRDDRWGMPVKAISDPDGNDLLFYDDDLKEA